MASFHYMRERGSIFLFENSNLFLDKIFAVFFDIVPRNYLL